VTNLTLKGLWIHVDSTRSWLSTSNTKIRETLPNAGSNDVSSWYVWRCGRILHPHYSHNATRFLYTQTATLFLFPVCLAGEEKACVCVFRLNLCKYGVTVATGCGSIHRDAGWRWSEQIIFRVPVWWRTSH